MSARSWLGKIFGRPAAPPQEPVTEIEVRWVPASENPWGVDVLDCTSVASSMVATTSSAEVARRFAALRGSFGDEHRGRRPEEAVTLACELSYPHRGETRDGPLHRAVEMEDKWDVFLFEGFLYFARSWTGELCHRAAITFHAEEARVTAVDTRRSLAARDPAFPIAEVDFLIRSHLYGLVLPHPLPSEAAHDPRELVLYSFSRYGRRGMFGAFADTTRLRALKRDAGTVTGER